ncbi:MAG: zf-HC2 domain-containing protein [Candidatus Aminicenantes bacterium]|nr:zf-HC2 domain-containing protein [Candidatus Aminicenantes bacterium]
MDGRLADAPRLEMEAHLASCRDCRGYQASLAMLQAVSKASLSGQAADPDPERMARSLARLKSGLKEASVRPAPFAGPRWAWAGAAAALLVATVGLYLMILRPGPAPELVPYAFSDARSGLALSLVEDEALALAFDSAIRASLVENSIASPAASEPLASNAGFYLDSLSDEDVLVLEAAIQESLVL